MNQISTKRKIKLARHHMEKALVYGFDAVNETKDALGIDRNNNFDGDFDQCLEVTGAIFTCEPASWEMSMLMLLQGVKK